MFKQHKAMIAGIAVCTVILASFYVASAEFSQKALAQNSTSNKTGNPNIAPPTATNATKSPTAVGGNMTSPTPTTAARNMSTGATAANMTNASGK
jgi:hypothetical protein